jgi:hypothetical protein
MFLAHKLGERFRTQAVGERSGAGEFLAGLLVK